MNVNPLISILSLVNYTDEPDYRIKGWNKTYILSASEGPIKNDIYPFAFSNDDINKLKKQNINILFIGGNINEND